MKRLEKHRQIQSLSWRGTGDTLIKKLEVVGVAYAEYATLGTRRELLKYETQEAGAGAAGDTPRQEGNEARNSNLGEDECERFEQMANNNQHNDSCATGAACVGCGIIQAPNVACGSQPFVKLTLLI